MILVFGKTGQVASALASREGVLAIGRDEADLTDSEACAAAISRYGPSAVINAAAYTAVDKAESEEVLATQINGNAPTSMAQTCVDAGIPFVHISTDYVFDGSGSVAWQPTDTPKPLGAYGRSKLAGERGVIDAGGDYVILRTSWVYSSVGSNFLKTMLRLGPERGELRVVDDQIGGPTPAPAIADACIECSRGLANAPEKRGVYHFSGETDVSWAEFASSIFSSAEIDCQVMRIPSSEYPTPAARPANSRLDCSTLKDVFGIDRPDWRAGLSEIIKDAQTP